MKHLITFLMLVVLSGCTSSPPPAQPKEEQNSPSDLTDAKVATAREAEGVAIQFLHANTKRYGGRDARARILTQFAFRAEAGIPDFATQGDRIWPVHETWFIETVCVVWVNAENGKVKIVRMKEESEQ